MTVSLSPGAFLTFESKGLIGSNLENLRAWLYSFLFFLSLAGEEGILVVGHRSAMLSPVCLQLQGGGQPLLPDCPSQRALSLRRFRVLVISSKCVLLLLYFHLSDWQEFRKTRIWCVLPCIFEFLLHLWYHSDVLISLECFQGQNTVLFMISFSFFFRQKSISLFLFTGKLFALTV